jgi:signal transduction histidine kinase
MTTTVANLDGKSREELFSELARIYAERDACLKAGRGSAAAAGEQIETERARRVEAERLGRVKDEFLANLSHELRTPLGAILGWAHILRSGTVNEEESAQGLDTIERNARVQARLIDDMLDMSRIITGKLRLDVQRVDLPATIASAVEAVRLAADAKGVRLDVIIDPIAGPVTGDPNRLQQVVSNLLSNAIKFTDRGGKVQVTLERVNSHVELSVSDTGAGIDPAFLPHVFERFSQADETLTRTNHGLGLGLAIVKNLSELHGGSVRAKSAGVGLGSTFIVALPVSIMRTAKDGDPGRHPGTSTDAPGPHDPDLDGVRVMMVDDDADAVDLVSHILGHCRADVTACVSGAECLASLGRVRPRVLLTDIGMGGMDGYALIKSIRTLPDAGGGRTPAAALTAFARSEDRRRALLAGFDMHVAKPVEPGELVAVVASLARRRT